MFQSARLKLTAWYLLIAMIISISFSGLIYGFISREVSRFEQRQREHIEDRIIGLGKGMSAEEGGKVQVLFRGIPPNDISATNAAGPFVVANRTFRIPVSPELIQETQNRILYILIGVNFVILILSGGVGYILAGRTLKPIKEMVEEQNRFISDASHELKTPLTSLKTAFEVYLRDEKPTINETRLLVEESIEEVNKLQSLSESLLQLAQYQKPKEQLHFEPILVSHLIAESIHKIGPLAKKKKISIHQESEEITLEGNRYSLVDMIVIFLDNAIKYSPLHSEIKIKTEKTDSHVIISIEDQGIGMSEEDKHRIFDRFYRADLARSKEDTNGYGLGLSIAKQIIEKHNGGISVTSELHKGSTFVVTLPLKQGNQAS